MRQSFKEQLLQKSNHCLLHNGLQESTHMGSSELSDELGVNTVNYRIKTQQLIHNSKR